MSPLAEIPLSCIHAATDFRTSSSSLTGSLHSLSCRHCRAGYAFHGAKITQPSEEGEGVCLVCFVFLVCLVGGPKTVCLVYLVHLVYLVRGRRRSVLLAGSETPPEEPDKPKKPDKPDKPDEPERQEGRVYLVCEAEGEAKIGYLVTGWPADSMAARILARDSASNSCP